MATEIGNKKVTRVIDSLFIRNKGVIARMTAEGVEIKLEKERWSGAYLVPWRAIYDVGAKLKARAIMEERKKRRKERRMGL